jgi:hypothetical protein
MKLRRFPSSLVCIAPMLFAAALQATTAVELTNLELTQQADTIVIGKCQSVRSAWEGRTLVTLATISISETLKGGVTGSITVTLPGGIDTSRKFPVSMTFPGAPSMQPEEEVFLFLAADPAISSGQTVLGFSQGKFSILTDSKQKKSVSRDLTNLTLVSASGPARGTRVLTSLEEFRNEVKKNLGQ